MDTGALLFAEFQVAQSIDWANAVNAAIPLVMVELQPLATPAQFAQGINYAIQIELLNAAWTNLVAPSIAQLIHL